LPQVPEYWLQARLAAGRVRLVGKVAQVKPEAQRVGLYPYALISGTAFDSDCGK